MRRRWPQLPNLQPLLDLVDVVSINKHQPRPPRPILLRDVPAQVLPNEPLRRVRPANVRRPALQQYSELTLSPATAFHPKETVHDVQLPADILHIQPQSNIEMLEGEMP